MIEFNINEFLKLKLEDGKTIIYVDGKRVIQCKYLLLNDVLDKSNQIEQSYTNLSMDEAIETLDRSLELNEDKQGLIPSETQFWAHSSNLQAWFENNYDTQILHSNISFPLLRKLTIAGDKKAEKVFKDEIIKRFKGGNLNVMTYLVKEGYLNHLDIEDSDGLFQELDLSTYRELNKRLQQRISKEEGFRY